MTPCYLSLVSEAPGHHQIPHTCPNCLSLSLSLSSLGLFIYLLLSTSFLPIRLSTLSSLCVFICLYLSFRVSIFSLGIRWKRKERVLKAFFPPFISSSEEEEEKKKKRSVCFGSFLLSFFCSGKTVDLPSETKRKRRR